MNWFVVWIRWEDGVIRPHAIYSDNNKAGREWDRLCRLDPKLDCGVYVMPLPKRLGGSSESGTINRAGDTPS